MNDGNKYKTKFLPTLNNQNLHKQIMMSLIHTVHKIIKKQR